MVCKSDDIVLYVMQLYVQKYYSVFIWQQAFRQDFKTGHPNCVKDLLEQIIYKATCEKRSKLGVYSMPRHPSGQKPVWHVIF